LARVRRGVARARYSEKPESVMYAEWPALSVQWRAALAGLSGTRQGVVSQLGAARVGSGVRELCPCVFFGAPGGLLGRQGCAPRQANEFPRTGAEPPRLCLLPLRGPARCAPMRPAAAGTGGPCERQYCAVCEAHHYRVGHGKRRGNGRSSSVLSSGFFPSFARPCIHRTPSVAATWVSLRGRHCMKSATHLDHTCGPLLAAAFRDDRRVAYAAFAGMGSAHESML